MRTLLENSARCGRTAAGSADAVTMHYREYLGAKLAPILFHGPIIMTANKGFHIGLCSRLNLS